MAFPRPSLEQIVERIQGDVKNATKIKTFLARSFISAFSKALGAVAHTIYGFIAWVFKQLFPFSQDREILLQWGAMFGLSLKDPTFSVLLVRFTGTDATSIPQGKEMQSETNIIFTAQETRVIEDGELEILVKCNLEGTSGNFDPGSAITLIDPIAGIIAEGEVVSIVTSGENQEDIESYRSRVLFRMANPPSGGNANDYVARCKELSGVTRVWVFPEVMGRGSVGIKFTVDELENIIPTNDKIAELLAWLEPWRPITARLEVTPPIPKPLDMVIAISPNSAEVRAAIETEIKDLIFRSAQVAGAYKNEHENYDGKLLLSKIREAVSVAAGEDDHEIISILGVAPANVVPEEAELIVPGEITWQSI